MPLASASMEVVMPSMMTSSHRQEKVSRQENFPGRTAVRV
jgi:hypothetical protein